MSERLRLSATFTVRYVGLSGSEMWPNRRFGHVSECEAFSHIPQTRFGVIGSSAAEIWEIEDFSEIANLRIRNYEQSELN